MSLDHISFLTEFNSLSQNLLLVGKADSDRLTPSTIKAILRHFVIFMIHKSKHRIFNPFNFYPIEELLQNEIFSQKLIKYKFELKIYYQDISILALDAIFFFSMSNFVVKTKSKITYELKS